MRKRMDPIVEKRFVMFFVKLLAKQYIEASRGLDDPNAKNRRAEVGE
jgi:hypothetical protein